VAYLAVIAGLAIGVAATVIGVNRWLDANAVPLALRASALAGPAPIYRVAAGTQVLVTFANDGEILYVCTLPGAPKLELNPRPGQEQAARFTLGEPGRRTLSCMPLASTATAGDAMDGEPSTGGGPDMGSGPSLPAVIFDVR
jgi:hypothetical protein